MQIASRQPMWGENGVGVEVVLELTPATGRFIHFITGNERSEVCQVDWGDGSGKQLFPSTGVYDRIEHTFPAYGAYKVVFRNISNIGFRWLDGQSSYPYDAAVLSVVDNDGTVTGAHSGAFTGCVNLERYIAPNNKGCGQRPFAYCTKLKEAVLGDCGIHYDGSFQGCTALESFKTVNTGCCWSYVWKGCTRLRELRLGNVTQFATQDFDQCPNLMDIWIDGKTVEQIRGTAPEGNIGHGYSAAFPWSANASCRFHGTNGIVLGNGTVIHE